MERTVNGEPGAGPDNRKDGTMLHPMKKVLAGAAAFGALALGGSAIAGAATSSTAVSYTHLTLPTNREV